MQWHQPVMEQGIKPNNFAWWLYASIFLVSFILYFFIMFFLNYSDDLKSLSVLIINLLLAPLTMALGCSLLLYSYYLSQKTSYQLRSEFIESKRRLWLNWIHQSLRIIDYSYISPIENNAIKIIGLDGHAIQNANQNLTIDRINNQLDSRLNKILQDLLKPLVKEFKKDINTFTIDVYAPYQTTQLKDALIVFFQKNDLMINASKQINFLPTIPDIAIIDEWIKDKKTRLVILLSLHLDNRTTTSEFAVTLLFSNNRATESRLATNLYRPLNTNLVNLSDDFSLLVNSQQIEQQDLRHIWSINMIESTMNTIITEVVENNLPIDTNKIHRLDLYEGRIDQGHSWLAIAYACEAINHGQKGQLITLQIEDNVYLLQMEKIKKIIKDKRTKINNDYPIIYLFSVLLLLIAICFLPKNNDERKLLLSFVLCGSFFFALLLSFSTLFKKKILTKKLENEWIRLQGENNE